MKILEGLNASVKILKNYVDKQIAEKVQQTTKEFNERLNEANENIQQTDIKIQQSDWNQNDESSIDHVKNRTHYDSVDYIPITFIRTNLTEQWIDHTSDIFNLKNGDVVKVNVLLGQGTTPPKQYVCKVVKKRLDATYNPMVFYIGNGNKYYSDDNYRSYLEDTGEPFCISMSSTSNRLCLSVEGATNTGVCTISKSVDVTHQLPQKYIQDSLDKHAMDTMPDWNQYDEKSVDYVKNRTHYTEPAFKQIVVESTFTERLSFDLFDYPYTDVEGKQAIIVFDGVEYKQSFRATQIHDKTYAPIVYHLGNIALDPGYNTSSYAVDTGEPFYIHAVGYAIPKDATKEHTITLSVQDGEIVHQLPQKYIPNTIQRTTDETLTTEDKAIVGAINEVNTRVTVQSNHNVKLEKRVTNLEKNGTGTGLSDDLKSALKSFFTNVQTLIPQLVFVSSENVGNTVIGNAQSIVTALDSTGGEEEEPDTPTDATLTSISATYTGGEVTVGTALTSLTGITVKATYSDGSTATVTGYTLSGTIAEGENTITVSYGGKTTAFTVTGVAESGGEVSEILYELPQTTTFDGTNGITTDIMLNDTDNDYTIMLDCTVDVANVGKVILKCVKLSTSIGVNIRTGYSAGSNKALMSYNGVNGAISNVNLTASGVQTIKTIGVHIASENKIYWYSIINGTRGDAVYNGAKQFVANNEVVTIGTEFIGTINNLKIYNRALTNEEIEAYLV